LTRGLKNNHNFITREKGKDIPDKEQRVKDMKELGIFKD
jgi:hypothetical protein